MKGDFKDYLTIYKKKIVNLHISCCDLSGCLIYVNRLFIEIYKFIEVFIEIYKFIEIT